MKNECYDEFFEDFSEEEAEGFQDRCNMDCDMEDYTHYT